MMEYSCKCQELDRLPHKRLTLINEIYGSRIYVCSTCGAIWEHNGRDEWGLTLPPAPLAEAGR